jgi:GTP-binding protein
VHSGSRIAGKQRKRSSPTSDETFSEQAVVDDSTALPLGGSRMPLVAIVGRPNVGKSTFFNHLVGRSQSIISATPGTTRDRVYGVSEWTGRAFMVVDTGGVFGNREDYFSPHIHEQAALAVKEADVILLMVDATAPPSQDDRKLAAILRRKGAAVATKVIVLANKADNDVRAEGAAAYVRLGLGKPIPISAAHGIGTIATLDALVEALRPFYESNTDGDAAVEPSGEQPKKPPSLRLCIVGRPNVGKSSLLNVVMGAERSIVSPVAGTTHDPVDQRLLWKGTDVTIVDTAGISRRGTHETGVGRTSILWAIKVIARSDVALLVLDGETGPTEQDARIASHIQENFKGCVILLNKMDLLPRKTHKDKWETPIRQQLKFLSYAPVLPVSARQGVGVAAAMDMALAVGAARSHRLTTHELNDMLRKALTRRKAPEGVNIKFVTQAKVAVPTFTFFVNQPDAVHFSYRRYLENCIREHWPFTGVPLRLVFKKATGKAARPRTRE